MSEPAEDEFDLTHWKEVCHAHEAELQWVRAENARLREAVSFYRAMLFGKVRDGGAIARAALAGEAPP